MKFSFWLTIGLDIFGLGIAAELDGKDRCVELQVGPINIFWWSWFGLNVRVLGCKVYGA